MKRIMIYPKDVMLVTGKEERTSRTLLANIKRYYGKKKHQAVSISEFCDYMGLTKEEVMECLR